VTKKGGPISSTPLQGFGRKELRHLKIDGRLDLHGMTMDEGYDALERFLIHAQEKRFKIVLIITGKGAVNSENTLRHQMPRWIKERPVRHLVSGFHSPARPQDGGQGACYIGVRKRS
jgi:DNA-nicking Smr family endonuclease